MRIKFKRNIAAVLLACVTVTGCGSSVGNGGSGVSDKDFYADYTMEEGKYPIKWDLDSIYASEAEWQADYDRAMELLDGYEQFRGKLDNAQTISELFDFAYFTELSSIQQKLYMYASLGYALDATDPVFNNMQAKLSAMNMAEAQQGSFVETEIFSLPLDQREEIFSDPVFGENKYWVRKYTDPDYEPLSEEESLIVSTMSLGYYKSEDIFNILSNIELPNEYIEMPDGKTKELTGELYYEIMNSPKYKDDFKVRTYRTYLSSYEDLSNTFAAILNQNCEQAYASALIKDYDDTLEASMDDYELDTDIFYKLIDTAHEAIPEYQKYLSLHKKGLGLEKQYIYNTSQNVSNYERGATNYDDAVDEIINALGVLGEDYTDHFKKIATSGHVDVYPTEKKESGAFENKFGQDYYPWVMFNYNGTARDVSDVAHEMGHAVYDQYASECQPAQYSNVTIFTQEVASTTNELLYAEYMVRNAKDDEEKLYYLENEIKLFADAFFTQMMFAEFEDFMYDTVEAGGALDAEELGDKWEELFKEYRGDTIEFLPELRYQWAGIEHFYFVYYVYQYAADMAYAASIVERINSGEKGAADDYLSFLKLGGSAAPADLLSNAGVDPLSDETYENAIAFFTSLVEEYESMINAR